MGTAWVVGRQNLPDEHEEIIEPAHAEGRLDGGRSFAFAQTAIQYMRMGDSIVIDSPAGLERSTFVGDGLPNPRPRQRNFKCAEAHAFQFNGGCHSADDLLL
jgi:hypothetical protein